MTSLEQPGHQTPQAAFPSPPPSQLQPQGWGDRVITPTWLWDLRGIEEALTPSPRALPVEQAEAAPAPAQTHPRDLRDRARAGPVPATRPRWPLGKVPLPVGHLDTHLAVPTPSSCLALTRW